MCPGAGHLKLTLDVGEEYYSGNIAGTVSHWVRQLMLKRP